MARTTTYTATRWVYNGARRAVSYTRWWADHVSNRPLANQPLMRHLYFVRSGQVGGLYSYCSHTREQRKFQSNSVEKLTCCKFGRHTQGKHEDCTGKKRKDSLWQHPFHQCCHRNCWQRRQMRPTTRRMTCAVRFASHSCSHRASCRAAALHTRFVLRASHSGCSCSGMLGLRQHARSTGAW